MRPVECASLEVRWRALDQDVWMQSGQTLLGVTGSNQHLHIAIACHHARTCCLWASFCLTPPGCGALSEEQGDEEDKLTKE